MRGILVIVTAVAIGAFVLNRGFDDTTVEAVSASEDGIGSETQDPSSTTTIDSLTNNTTTTVAADDSAMEETDETAETTSTTSNPAAPGIRAPADVPVLVLNGAGAKGVAGRGSEVLQTAGYDVLAPKNATVFGPTQVLYTEGFEAEAQAVAEAFGVDPVAVVSAYDPASPPINDIREAIVIVVIGQDGLIDV